MREERLAHRGNSDYLPRPKGSAEAIFTEGRGQNRSFFVQATLGKCVRERRSNGSRKKTQSWIGARSMARALNDEEHKIMPASKDFLTENPRDRSAHRRIVNIG